MSGLSSVSFRLATAGIVARFSPSHVWSGIRFPPAKLLPAWHQQFLPRHVRHSSRTATLMCIWSPMSDPSCICMAGIFMGLSAVTCSSLLPLSQLLLLVVHCSLLLPLSQSSACCRAARQQPPAQVTAVPLMNFANPAMTALHIVPLIHPRP